jgi:hypothetical protein
MPILPVECALKPLSEVELTTEQIRESIDTAICERVDVLSNYALEMYRDPTRTYLAREGYSMADLFFTGDARDNYGFVYHRNNTSSNQDNKFIKRVGVVFNNSPDTYAPTIGFPINLSVIDGRYEAGEKVGSRKVTMRAPYGEWSLIVRNYDREGDEVGEPWIYNAETIANTEDIAELQDIERQVADIIASTHVS